MYKIKIGEGSCGISAGAGKIHKLLDEKNSGNYTVHAVGCIGMCFLEPILWTKLWSWDTARKKKPI